jgi:hypothetical protein
MVSKETLETVPIGTIINAVYAIDSMLYNKCEYMREPGEDPATTRSRYKELLDPDQHTPLWFYTGLPEEDNKAIVAELKKGTEPREITSRMLRQYRTVNFEHGPPTSGCGFLYEYPDARVSGFDIETYKDDLKEWCGEEDAVVRALQDVQDGVAPDAERCGELKAVLKVIEARMAYCEAIRGAMITGCRLLESVPGALSPEMRDREMHFAYEYVGRNPYEGAGYYYALLFVHNDVSKYLADAGVEGMKFLDWYDGC